MIRRREISIALVCLAGAGLVALPLSSQAAEAVPGIVASVRQRMVDAPVLRGDFEQRKTIKGFKNPLVSRGDFLVARAKGVLWRTREPFASSLVVTRERLLSRQADGNVVNQMNARDEPGLRAINEMLFALMAADLQTLAQRFRIDGELLGTDAWRLVLLPRDAGLARWVTRIELDGDRFVRNVRLSEAQGDLSTLQFSKQATANALTRDEEAAFE